MRGRGAGSRVCMRCERPSRSTADEREELAALHSSVWDGRKSHALLPPCCATCGISALEDRKRCDRAKRQGWRRTCAGSRMSLTSLLSLLFGRPPNTRHRRCEAIARRDGGDETRRSPTSPAAATSATRPSAACDRPGGSFLGREEFHLGPGGSGGPGSAPSRAR